MREETRRSKALGWVMQGLTWMALLHLGGPPHAFAQTEDEAPPSAAEEEGRRRFLQGIELARAGNCEAAIAELTASFDLVPRPNTLYNIAQCRETLAQYDLAIQAYQRYLELAPADDPERAAVEATIRTMGNLLGILRIESNVEAEVWLGDRRVGTAPGSIRVPGGTHVVELRAESHLPARQSVEIAGRQSATLEFRLERSEERVEHTIERVETRVEEKGLDPAFFWAGVALTGVTAAAGGIFGVRALTLKSDAEDLDPRLPRAQEADDIQGSALLADILFASAGALAIGTVVIYFLTDWDDEEQDVASITIAGSLFPGGATLNLGGAL